MKHLALAWWLLTVGLSVACGGKVGGSSSSASGTSIASGGALASDLAGSPGSSCTIRVARTGSDSNSGVNLTEALASVQKALDVSSTMIGQAVCSIVEVWVATGTYRPTYLADSADARSATFQLVANVDLYGGFAGDESLRTERSVGTNVTILSGDIGTPAHTSDNSYHVVTGVTGATPDGFTVTGGNANGSMYIVGKCGGMYNLDTCVPSAVGGGMYNDEDSAPTVTNCTFTGNSAVTEGGGMYYNADTSPTVTGCTFTGNRAGHSGGGMSTQGTAPVLVTNCILWSDKVGTSVSEIFNPSVLGPEPPAPARVSYSIVQSGYALGTNIITADPLFVDAANGNLHLNAGSPGIDAGNGCAKYVALTDQADNSRWDMSNVPNQVDGLDIGAFEYQGTAGMDTRITDFNCP